MLKIFITHCSKHILGRNSNYTKENARNLTTMNERESKEKKKKKFMVLNI